MERLEVSDHKGLSLTGAYYDGIYWHCYEVWLEGGKAYGDGSVQNRAGLRQIGIWRIRSLRVGFQG